MLSIFHNLKFNPQKKLQQKHYRTFEAKQQKFACVTQNEEQIDSIICYEKSLK